MWQALFIRKVASHHSASGLAKRLWQFISGLWDPRRAANASQAAVLKNKERAENMNGKRLFIFTSAVCIVIASACKSGVAGTYSDANGAVILELRSGGSASFTFMGDVEDCSYKSTDKQLTLTCKGSPVPTTVFNIHDDGSLTGPAGAFMPPLRKQKS